MQQPHKEKITEEVRQEVLRRIERSAAFQRTFTGKDGELILDEFKKMRRDFDPDPYINAYNSRMRDLLDFIETAMNQDVESARKVLEEQKKE